MSLTFYGAPHSTASVTALVFEELGVPHEVVTVDIRKGDAAKSELKKLNPNGKVPTLVHDGTVIWESSAITMYLGETFGVDKKLWPAAGPKRGEAMRWVTWSNVTLGEAISRWLRNTSEQWVPAEQRNASAGEAAKKDVDNSLGILDESLAGRSFLLGGDYTLVDAHVSSFIEWLRSMKVDFARWKSLEAWAKRCSSRPASERLLQRENATAGQAT
jgi:glutathione S-transferase